MEQLVRIVVSSVAIVGASAIALVCDLLNADNERLRQANLELEVRREEEQRRTELALNPLNRMSQVSAAPSLAHRPPRATADAAPVANPARDCPEPNPRRPCPKNLRKNSKSPHVIEAGETGNCC